MAMSKSCAKSCSKTVVSTKRRAQSAVVLQVLLLGGLLLNALWVRAESPSAPGRIYTCVDAAGRKHTSDRPIPECQTREQRVLNSDGSTKNVLGPALTADERATNEAREQALLTERANRQ
jgi:hypothetical protein